MCEFPNSGPFVGGILGYGDFAARTPPSPPVLLSMTQIPTDEPGPASLVALCSAGFNILPHAGKYV